MERAVRKDIGHLHEMCRRLIAASPMLVVASVSEDGRCERQPGWTVEQEEQRQRDSLLHQLDWASIASRVRRS
jgi:predicted pyridoxine 5'-phosphate oxidase superfamily flavin-nucleotide-binding protein